MDERPEAPAAEPVRTSVAGVPEGRTTVPELPGWLVPRPRLAERVSRGVLGPLTVVVGPVGAGKSALATEWLHTGRAPGPVACVRCEGREERPDVFWPRVLSALCDAGVDLTECADVPVNELLVARLAVQLALCGTPVVLVLDDFQPEQGSPVAEGVASLLKHAAPVLRLVVLSRRDPPLHLHRYRLAGELTELRTADLAFTDAETAALLAQHGLDIARNVVRALRRRTAGWAAGIRLAAMSMQGQRDPDRFIARFAGDDEAIVTYLVEEVLDAQSAEMRRLLLTTSVLEQVNAELATAVAGADAGRHFALLVRQNSFLQPLGQGWFRCHRMFADVLQVRLQHELPGSVAAAHRRAAAWLAEHGFLATAVGHALAADDRPYASRLVVEQLGIGQLLGLTATRLPDMPTPWIPAESRTDDPEPVLVAAAIRHPDADAGAGQLAEAARLIDRLPETEPDRVLRCRLTHAVIRMAGQRSRDPAAARAAAVEARALSARLPAHLLAERPEIKALTLFVLGRSETRAGDLKAAESLLTGGLKAAGATGNEALRRGCLVELALLEAVRGRFRAAGEFAALATRPPLPAWTARDGSHATLAVVRAWVALARAEPDLARGELARARTALHTLADPFTAGVAVLVGRLVNLAEQGVSEVHETLLGTTGPWLPPALRQPVVRACAASLGASASGATAHHRDPGAVLDPAAVSVERLTAREGDVLGRLSQMMTTEEIAEDLYLSVNTVKTHLKSVYRKLAVTRRSAAVRRARELQLL
ncbi:LuxR family transcriptional regulator [Streptomyces kanamyceticus]|uniref:LuxR family transcriptional regulator n=1 Tax=Streptomyces kanamyceticus TaxID=1967 RepID=A0A5J6GBV0_STRKN|nr:LuxR family transcriptional regulator [Streptomyces kanamyceticus]QEU93310.1 LuxR family transcriptional regulator [Streptomyces kanamyceticus]